MSPTVGRIVHFQTYGTPGGEHPSEPIAAIVTAVHDSGVADLFAIYPNGTSHKTGVMHAPADIPTPGYWNWPPRS